jgi:hypothetical protein
MRAAPAGMGTAPEQPAAGRRDVAETVVVPVRQGRLPALQPHVQLPFLIT